MINAVKYYKDVLKHDNTHVEAVACIANYHFYSDQPEIALRYYRLGMLNLTSAKIFHSINYKSCIFYA